MGREGRFRVQGGSLSLSAERLSLSWVPRKAWRFLQGGSPCRVRSSQPPVLSVGTVKEVERREEKKANDTV